PADAADLGERAVDGGDGPGERARAGAGAHPAHVLVVLDAARHAEEERQLTAGAGAAVGLFGGAEGAPLVELDEGADVPVAPRDGVEAAAGELDRGELAPPDPGGELERRRGRDVVRARRP